MRNRYKVVFFGIVMSVIVLVTSMAVFAKINFEDVAVGTGFGRATIYLEDDVASFAYASTTGPDVLSTNIYGGGPTPRSAEGGSYAEISTMTHAFTYAESNHYWVGRHWALSIFT